MSQYDRITAEIIATVIGSHHGLFDCLDGNHSWTLDRRRSQTVRYDETIRHFFRQCASEDELDARFQKASEEIGRIIEIIKGLPPTDMDYKNADDEICFYIGLLVRLLLSSLIDADRRDTAEFMRNTRFPSFPEDMRKLWEKSLASVEAKLNALPNDTSIQRARREISEACARFAAKPCGVYRLNVPTGGGKTLSSLRFALAHAACFHKKHIIFTAPLLSIIDQNAKEIRRYVDDDSIISEHHSNVVHAEQIGDELNDMELYTEAWSAPIIITTMVQLLNTMFSGKSDAIRRFHSLSDSVIVIDEVQTIPNKMLSLFNLAVNFLSEVCHATVVLCSATQPELAKTAHPLRKEPQDIIPYNKELWDVFKRTEIQITDGRRLSEIPDICLDALKNADSILIVCNKKAEALTLFNSFSHEDYQCFHLSAGMCTQHRRDTLSAMESALKHENNDYRKIICVSTQVIEAGVDISFACVVRLCAGMDSIVQAAGRCNRNGESASPAPVFVVNCIDEQLNRLTEIKRGKEASIELFTKFNKNKADFDGDLTSNAAIKRYYRILYGRMDKGEQDYTTKYGTLFRLLGYNPIECDGKYFLRQSFKTAGSLFTVFDEDTTSVIVRYKSGSEIAEKLIAEDRGYNRNYDTIDKLIREAKLYTVSMRQYEIDALEKQGGIMRLFDDSIIILSDGYYDEATGFAVKNGADIFMEV